MTEYETLLDQAYSQHYGVEYRTGGKGSWELDGSMPKKYSSAMIGRHTNRGLVPTKNYTEHLLDRRTALSELINGKEAGMFMEMSEELLTALQDDRDEIDSTIVIDHMLLAAKVIHRYFVNAKPHEIDDILSMAAQKIVQCIEVRDRDCAFSTYIWAAVRNLVFSFNSRTVDTWETMDLLNEANLPSKQTSRVCMPGQYFMEQLPNEADGPLESIEKREMLTALSKVLEFRADFLTINEDLILSSWTGLEYGYGGSSSVPQRTIAKEMNMTPQAVNSALTSGLSKVANKLEKLRGNSDMTFFRKYLEE